MKRIINITFFLLVLLIPFNIYALDFDISSNNAILYNTKEDNIMFEKNSNDKTSIASLTKITTGIVALENIKDLDSKITLTNKDFAGLREANASVAGFRVGQEVTYRDLLYGLMLPSGADAAQALTRNISGSNEEFVKLMNEKVKELGLENTNYVNATGLDDPNHYSTVSDVLKIFKYALNNKDFKEIVTSSKYTTSDKTITFKSTLSKYSNLEMDYLLGGKTGTTGDAGLCLATLANYDDTDFILVTTKAEYPSNPPKSFLDQKKIYEYVRDNYDYHEIVNKKDKLVTLNTKYVKEDSIDFYSPKTINLYLENSFDKNKVEYKYSGKKTITHNMNKGDKIGKVDIVYNGDVLDTVDILLIDNPEFSLKKYLLDHKLIVISCLIIIVLFIIFIISKGKKRKNKTKKRN